MLTVCLVLPQLDIQIPDPRIDEASGEGSGGGGDSGGDSGGEGESGGSGGEDRDGIGHQAIKQLPPVLKSLASRG